MTDYDFADDYGRPAGPEPSRSYWCWQRRAASVVALVVLAFACGHLIGWW